MAVEQRHAEPVAGGVARQIGAHDRQSKHAKIGFLRFCHWLLPVEDACTLTNVVGGIVVFGLVYRVEIPRMPLEDWTGISSDRYANRGSEPAERAVC